MIGWLPLCRAAVRIRSIRQIIRRAAVRIATPYTYMQIWNLFVLEYGPFFELSESEGTVDRYQYHKHTQEAFLFRRTRLCLCTLKTWLKKRIYYIYLNGTKDDRTRYPCTQSV